MSMSVAATKPLNEDCSDKKSLLSLALLRGITIIETKSKLTQTVKDAVKGWGPVMLGFVLEWGAFYA